MSNTLPRSVQALIAADVPVMLWGPPGTGKTAAVMQAALEEEAHVEVLVGSTVDPVDVGGFIIPQPNGDTRVSPPPWVRRLRGSLDLGRQSWLFLDELSCAPPSVQAALLRVINERSAAGVDLSGCRVLAAANPAETATDGGWLAPATANRMSHVEWRLDRKVWLTGTLAGWRKARTQAWAAAAASVAGWISRSPDALLAVPTNSSSSRAWPSPRMWTAGISALAMLDGGARNGCALEVMSACVGAPAANEWMTWVMQQDLPDAEDVLAGRASIPARGDRQLSTALAMVAAAASEHAERGARLAAAVRIVAAMRRDVAIAPARVLLSALDGDVPEELRWLGEEIADAVAVIRSAP